MVIIKKMLRNLSVILKQAVAALLTIVFCLFVLNYAHTKPQELGVSRNTVKSADVYAPYDWQCAEKYNESEKIEWALFQQATDWMEFEATAYCNCEKCCGEWSKYHSTYTGAVPQEGITIAVDPDVIPLYSQVFVQLPNEVWHCYTAQDIGGAIKGNRVDIYFENHEDALKFGRQKVLVCYTVS